MHFLPYPRSLFLARPLRPQQLLTGFQTDSSWTRIPGLMPSSPTAASIASWLLLGSLLLAVCIAPSPQAALCSRLAPNRTDLPVQVLLLQSLARYCIAARRVPARHSGSCAKAQQQSYLGLLGIPAGPVTTKTKWLMTAGHARALPCEWLRQAEHFCH